MTETTAEWRFSIDDPAYDADPWAMIAEARRRGGWQVPMEGGIAVLDQESSRFYLRDPRMRFWTGTIDAERLPYLAQSADAMLAGRHGADHTRLRKLVLAALRDRVVEDLRPVVRGIAHDLLDAMGSGGQVDLVEAFTEPLPVRVVGPMFGVPYDRIANIDEWIRIAGGIIDPVTLENHGEDIENAWRDIESFVREVVNERAEDLGSDIISELIRAEVEGDRLSRDEVVITSTEMAHAGVDTTRAQLAITLRLLLQNPDQWALLKQDPALVGRAVEEGLRYAPLIHSIWQQATERVEHRDVVLEAGDVATVIVLAANRDPEIFEEPDRFDVTRQPKGQLTFGFGMHACVGAALARLEMAEALTALLERVTSWEAAGEIPMTPITAGQVPLALPVNIELAPRR